MIGEFTDPRQPLIIGHHISPLNLLTVEVLQINTTHINSVSETAEIRVIRAGVLHHLKELRPII